MKIKINRKYNRVGTPSLDVTDYTIIAIGPYYHYINHDDKLITTGLGSIASLKKYSDSFLAIDTTLALMSDRYYTIFPDDWIGV